MKPECQAFRDQFEPGLETSHRSQCAGCRAFAEAVEAARAAAHRPPLPPGLEWRLTALARREGQMPPRDHQAEPPAPVPMLPMPPALEQRLRRLGRQQAPPHWLRSPAATLAASLIFTALLGSVVEDPAGGIRRLAARFEQRLEATASPELPPEPETSERWTADSWQQALAPAEVAWRRTVASVNAKLEIWVERLEAALPETKPQPSTEGPSTND